MQTEPVSKQIQELQALRREKRMWSVGTTIFLILIVAWSVLSLKNAVYGLINEGPTREAFQKQLGEHVQKDAVPKIQEYGEQAIRGVDYAGAVKKLNARTPELVKATTDQLHLLNDDLTKRGNKVFDQTFTAAVKDHDKKIRAMFPDANEEKVSSLMANLTKEAQDQVADINDTLFSSHKKALDDIVSDMTLIQHSEPNVQGETPSWELALMIFDIARDDLKSLEPVANDKAGTKTPASKPDAGKGKK